jgi:serine/threonine protein kinase
MAPEDTRTIGPWSLGDKLGRGGNATVWMATRSTFPEPVALKVIASTKTGKEQYRRFVREIEFLRSLSDASGVLPLLDAYLPAEPSKDDRPWLAMPIATPIAEALADVDLETIVAALAQVAETLARLAAEHEVAHRDVKPSNLYELDGQWLVGDFGLVAVPDKEELTRTGKALGPAHYTAYEMILDAAKADPFPADVYSFGKTLWVLATEQAFPPEGYQLAGTRQFSITDFRPHPHAAALDELVERTTQLHPEERPSMAEVARDLRAWTQLRSTPIAIDLGNRRQRLREALASELTEADVLSQRKEQAMSAVRRMHELFTPLNAALKDAHPHAQIDVSPDRLTQNMLSTASTLRSDEIVFTFQRLSQITTGPDAFPFALRLGRGLELTRDGDLIFRSYIDVSHTKTTGSEFHWRSEERRAPVGSVQADVMLQEGIEETASKLTEGIDAFIEFLGRRN